MENRLGFLVALGVRLSSPSQNRWKTSLASNDAFKRYKTLKYLYGSVTGQTELLLLSWSPRTVASIDLNFYSAMLGRWVGR